MKCINQIDNMKAMGITLVVLGHAAWLDQDIYFNILIPYAIVLISYLSWLPLNILGDGQVCKIQWFDPLSWLITSKADSFHINGVLWFFPCLIVISLAQIVFFSALKPIYSFVITSGVLVLMLLSNELISEGGFGL